MKSYDQFPRKTGNRLRAGRTRINLYHQPPKSVGPKRTLERRTPRETMTDNETCLTMIDAKKNSKKVRKQESKQQRNINSAKSTIPIHYHNCSCRSS